MIGTRTRLLVQKEILLTPLCVQREVREQDSEKHFQGDYDESGILWQRLFGIRCRLQKDRPALDSSYELAKGMGTSLREMAVLRFGGGSAAL